MSDGLMGSSSSCGSNNAIDKDSLLPIVVTDPLLLITTTEIPVINELLWISIFIIVSSCYSYLLL